MIDNDPLSLEDQEQKNADAGVAFNSADPMGPRELMAYAKMQQCAGRIGNAVLFIIADDDGGPDYWDEGEAERWRALLGWTVAPTIEQAQAAQTHARASAMASWFERLRTARAADALLGYTALETAQPLPDSAAET